jgi:hypothetical protein
MRLSGRPRAHACACRAPATDAAPRVGARWLRTPARPTRSRMNSRACMVDPRTETCDLTLKISGVQNLVAMKRLL